MPENSAMPQPHPASRDFSIPASLFSGFLCVLFGANAVAIKVSFQGLGVFTTAGLRFGMAAAAIFLWMRVTGRRVRPHRSQLVPLLITSAVFTLQLSLVYAGLHRTNASRGALLSNLQPFFVLFLAHFFIAGDRITGRKLLGLVLGFAGVAFVFLENAGVAEGYRSGDVMIMLATLLWAANMVYLKTIIAAHSAFQIVLFQTAFCVPFFLVEAVLWDAPMIRGFTAPVTGALFYQGLVTASFGFVAWNRLLQRYGAVALHSFVFLMPVSGVLLAGVLLGEPITAKILLALALIVGGLIAVHFKARKAVGAYPLRRGI
jgi:drug/metabolite transporter (DMT)-like permease